MTKQLLLRLYRHAYLAIAISYLLLIAFGYINFKIYPQAMVLWEYFIHPAVNNISAGGAYFLHLPRTILVVPALLLAKIFGINENWLFSLMVGGIIVVLPKILASVVNCMRGVMVHDVVQSVILLFLIACSTFMNGRISFALLGISLLFWAVSYKSCMVFYFGLLLMVAFLLLMVSSGTHCAGYFIFVYWLAGNISVISKKKSTVCLVIFIMQSVIFLNFAVKNLKFYGDGVDAFYKMLTHGLGIYIINTSGVWLLALLIVWIAFGYIIRKQLKVLMSDKSLRTIVISFFIVLICSLNGLSVLALAIPITLLFIMNMLVI